MKLRGGSRNSSAGSKDELHSPPKAESISSFCLSKATDAIKTLPYSSAEQGGPLKTGRSPFMTSMTRAIPSFHAFKDCVRGRSRQEETGKVAKIFQEF